MALSDDDTPTQAGDTAFTMEAPKIKFGAGCLGVAAAGDLLADRVIEPMRATGIPNGLRGVGYGTQDIAALTDRSLVQKRLIDNAPCAVSRDQLQALFTAALGYW